MSSILIVDDSRVMRDILKDEVISNGHTVAGEASDGREALRLFQMLKPDAVLMDITMDDMDGIEAIGLILSTGPKTVIIVVSALCDAKVIREAKKLGAVDYLTKPFTSEEFKACIEKNL